MKSKKMNKVTWEDIKMRGSEHYKGGVEPIDLFKGTYAHEDLDIMQIKALADIIKYSYRMLMKGVNKEDIEKIKHYADIADCIREEKGK